MKRKNLYIFSAFSILFIFFSCNPDAVRREFVNQMQVNVVQNEIELATKNSWEPVGQTFILMNTSDTSNFTCLFIAEAIGAMNPSLLVDNQAFYKTRPLQVRILVDGEVAFPSQASFTPSAVWADKDHFSSHSFLAIKRNVPPGIHSIVVEWNQPREFSYDIRPRMGSRTLSVWQSTEEAISIVP